MNAIIQMPAAEQRAWRNSLKRKVCSRTDFQNNPQYIHTPYDLCHEMVEKLDQHANLKESQYFLTFNLEFAEVLCYSMGIERNKIWFVTECLEKANVARQHPRYAGINVVTENYLTWRPNMKFDVIVGNPPYQTKSDMNDRKTQPLWHKFVSQSFDLLKEGGYLCMVHPSGWRNVAGVFKQTQNLLKSKNMQFLKLHRFREGQIVFGVAINFDYYILKNEPNCGLTTVVFEDGVEKRIDISKMEFIPGENFDEIKSLIAKDGEERVKIINNSCYHHQKDYTAKEQDYKFQYPCVYTVRSPDKGNQPTFYYSTKNDKGHFGIPKVIFAGGASGVFIDKYGEYGMTEFASAIVDKPENLENIKKALQSEHFIRKIMGFKESLGDKYNRKVIALFRKDFWKQFVLS